MATKPKKPKKEWTRNEAVEMMNQNTANALNSIANFVEKYEYDADEIIEYMRDIAQEMEAQALVVSLRDELLFDKPKD